MTYTERVSALQPLTQYGPSYNRNVSVALSDSAIFANRGEEEAAEMRAGLMSFEEWERATAALEGKLAV